MDNGNRPNCISSLISLNETSRQDPCRPADNGFPTERDFQPESIEL